MSNSTTILAKNVPRDMSFRQIEQYFSNFGAVQGVKLSFVPDQQAKPSAIISFEDKGSAVEVARHFSAATEVSDTPHVADVNSGGVDQQSVTAESKTIIKGAAKRCAEREGGRTLDTPTPPYVSPHVGSASKRMKPQSTAGPPTHIPLTPVSDGTGIGPVGSFVGPQILQPNVLTSSHSAIADASMAAKLRILASQEKMRLGPTGMVLAPDLSSGLTLGTKEISQTMSQPRPFAPPPRR